MARLVNHRLNEIATPLLFESITLSLHQQRINRFKAICEHKTFSPFIKEVIYDTTTFWLPTYEDFQLQPYYVPPCLENKVRHILFSKQTDLVYEQP